MIESASLADRHLFERGTLRNPRWLMMFLVKWPHLLVAPVAPLGKRHLRFQISNLRCLPPYFVLFAIAFTASPAGSGSHKYRSMATLTTNATGLRCCQARRRSSRFISRVTFSPRNSETRDSVSGLASFAIKGA